MADVITAPRSEAAAAPRVGRRVLSVRDLAVEFALQQGSVRALDAVSLDLHAGRVLGVVGESGSGKSVTARAILGILDRPGRIVSRHLPLHPAPPHPHAFT